MRNLDDGDNYGPLSKYGVDYHRPIGNVNAMPPPSLDHPQSSQLPYQPESLILPDGPVDGEAAELLEDFVHSQHDHVDVDADYHVRKAHHKHLPWYKVPTPWW